MIGELMDMVRLVVGFLPWILFLFLPTDGWEPLRRAVLVCLDLTCGASSASWASLALA
jgi:hypothetical protein